MKYENVKFEFADFLLLKHPSYTRVSDKNKISVLMEFVNLGFFCVTEQEKKHDGCISFERTENGALFYDRLLNEFEDGMNREMEKNRQVFQASMAVASALEKEVLS